uniref:Putative secreted protein n=1 Tax=Xenopsylla cheopis TaxID=163159 RepID=A0A6M2DH01_XENCH
MERLDRNVRDVSSRSVNSIGPKRIVPKDPPQHAELINFIHESWHKVAIEIEQGGCSSTLFYRHTSTDPRLKEFKPFDLESFWGRRMVQNFRNHP